MRTTLNGLIAAAVLATGGLAAAAPAEAQGYYRDYRHYDRGYHDRGPRWGHGYRYARPYYYGGDWDRRSVWAERRLARERWERRNGYYYGW